MKPSRPLPDLIALGVLSLTVLAFAIDVWIGSPEKAHASAPVELSYVVFEDSRGLPDLGLVLVDTRGEARLPDAAGRFAFSPSLEGECFEVRDGASGDLLRQWTFQRSPGGVTRVAVARGD